MVLPFPIKETTVPYILYKTALCVFPYMFEVCPALRERFVSRDQDFITRGEQLPY